MPKKLLPREKMRQIAAVLMRNNGYSLIEIAGTIGVTRQRVDQILRKHDLTDKKPSATMDNNKVAKRN